MTTTAAAAMATAGAAGASNSNSGREWRPRGGYSKQPDRQEGATVAASGCITGVHEAEDWVDPISQAEPSRGERLKVETQEWRLGAIPVSPSIPVFLFLDSTPF